MHNDNWKNTQKDALLKPLIDIIHSQGSSQLDKTDAFRKIERDIFTPAIAEHRFQGDKTLLMHLVIYHRRAGSEKLVRELATHCPSCMHVRDKKGNSVLMHAAMHDCHYLIQLVVDWPLVHIQLKNDHNQTAFMLASQREHRDFMKAMLQKKLPVDQKEKEEALCLAAEHGYADVVDFLLVEGVDSTVKNSAGQTPLESAELHQHLLVIECLQRQYFINSISLSSDYCIQKIGNTLGDHTKIPFIRHVISLFYRDIQCLETPNNHANLSPDTIGRLYSLVVKSISGCLEFIPGLLYQTANRAPFSGISIPGGRFIAQKIIQPTQNKLLAVSDEHKIHAISRFHNIPHEATSFPLVHEASQPNTPQQDDRPFQQDHEHFFENEQASVVSSSIRPSASVNWITSKQTNILMRVVCFIYRLFCFIEGLKKIQEQHKVELTATLTTERAQIAVKAGKSSTSLTVEAGNSPVGSSVSTASSFRHHLPRLLLPQQMAALPDTEEAGTGILMSGIRPTGNPECNPILQELPVRAGVTHQNQR